MKMSAWCMKLSPSGAPCAVEMFLHHEEHQRVSFGVIHAPDGKLQQLSLIREDTRERFILPTCGYAASPEPPRGSASLPVPMKAAATTDLQSAEGRTFKSRLSQEGRGHSPIGQRQRQRRARRPRACTPRSPPPARRSVRSAPGLRSAPAWSRARSPPCLGLRRALPSKPAEPQTLAQPCPASNPGQLMPPF